jgi:hypothetical protein
VYYNKPYTIVPGVNIIKSPDTLYPYSTLNINDTKFIESGAFSFITPEFSDKIFLLSTDTNILNGGQSLLCTWLSGHPQSNTKIWVDRYYYPDLISKEEALVSRTLYDTTYDNYIENLIMSNSEIKNAVSNIKFFDKKSDFYFRPNETYEYHRINIIPESITPINKKYNCNPINYPQNYFKEINESGEFTISFYFDGDEKNNWVIQSDRNEIECEIIFRKMGNKIEFGYKLYDPTTKNYTNYTTTTTIVSSKYNILSCSINAVTGIGYLFINNKTVYKFSLVPYKFLRRQLLYGDFILIKDNTRYNFIEYNGTDIINISISPDYLDESYLYLLSSLSELTIDTIHITLPCGMRNSVDNIDILNDICNSSSFKSNNINLIFKNVDNNINSKDLKNYLNGNIQKILPLNVEIDDIVYRRFKSTP